MSPQIGAGHGSNDRERFVPNLAERLQVAFPRVTMPEPFNEPAVQVRTRVAVGGSLHGRVLRVPVTSSVVYADSGTAFEIEHARDLRDDGVTYRATTRFELYEVMDRGKTGLIVSADLLKSAGTPIKGNGLQETIVEALGIAAGVSSTSPALVRQLVDVEALRQRTPGTE